MWIGNERSVTALHKDNYENIYVQVRGEKQFVLLSPMEMPCVNEQALCEAHYRPSKCRELRPDDELVIQCSADELLPVPTWDPDNRDFRATRYSHLARPLRVTLKEGDMLYLPAMSVLRNSMSNCLKDADCPLQGGTTRSARRRVKKGFLVL